MFSVKVWVLCWFDTGTAVAMRKRIESARTRPRAAAGASGTPPLTKKATRALATDKATRIFLETHRRGDIILLRDIESLLDEALIASTTVNGYDRIYYNTIQMTVCSLIFLARQYSRPHLVILVR